MTHYRRPLLLAIALIAALLGLLTSTGAEAARLLGYMPA